MIKPGVLRK